jgi:hypothetical protein
MRKLLTFIVSLAVLGSAVNAQKITGVITDQQGKGIEKSTVTLLRAKDSVAIKFAATDKSGVYSFPGIKAGHYFISATSVGYLKLASPVFEVTAGTETRVNALSLARTEKTLEGATVTSKKPMIEVKADKTILNVEGTINATGNDALELLRKSPGVTVDKDDNISLSGKNGVQVYIDGKPTPLSGTDLSNYLKSIQSSQIESIELITNPSAKYEAAGNAGIINIRLKKNKTIGLNGSVNAGWNIANFPSTTAASHLIIATRK